MDSKLDKAVMSTDQQLLELKEPPHADKAWGAHLRPCELNIGRLAAGFPLIREVRGKVRAIQSLAHLSGVRCLTRKHAGCRGHNTSRLQRACAPTRNDTEILDPFTTNLMEDCNLT